MKKTKYQLWDMQEQYGMDYNSEIDCLDRAMEISDYTKPHYYLILNDKEKLIKTVTVDRGSLTWTNHAKP